MTNEQILKKAIEKAIENGWNIIGKKFEIDNENGFVVNWWVDKEQTQPRQTWIETIIFSHDFAKAFWGEKDYRTETVGELDARRNHNKLCWEYHLQKMVLTKEPLRYLEKFL